MTSDIAITTQPTSRKQRIQEEAAKLFRDKGYMATSMRDLAQAVGLEPSSLYSHIKSKQELLRHICFNCGRQFTDGIRKLRKETYDPVDALRALIRLHVTIAHNDITTITVFNDEWRHLEEPSLTDFQHMRKSYEDACRELIEEGIEAGIFRNLDSKTTLFTLLSSMQWIYRSKRTASLDIDDITERIASIILYGITK